MTEQMIRNAPAERDRPVEITPQMIEAGVCAFFDFVPDAQLGSDEHALLVERIFQAMDATNISSAKNRPAEPLPN